MNEVLGSKLMIGAEAVLTRASYTDLHNHVVPGVDDGSRSVEESLESLRSFRQAGVDRIVATPHLYVQHLDGARELTRTLQFLRREFDFLAATAAGVDGAVPEMRFGQEICAPNAWDIRRVVDEAELGLGSSAFLLVEFGFELRGDPEAVIEAVHEAGREIVIAHPERYRYPDGPDPVERMRRWVEAGAYLQVNLGSLRAGEGAYGAAVARLGWRLIDEGLAHLLASDHHCRARPQIVHREIHEALLARGGVEQAKLLLEENPRRIFAGEAPLPVEALCSGV